MSKYIVCLYDLEGNLLSSRKYGCRGCAIKHAPRATPACIRETTSEGKILWKNKAFEDLK